MQVSLPALVVGVAVFWLLMGVLAAWIAPQKRRSAAEGFLLGFLFGPIGVLVELLLPDGAGRPEAGHRPSLLDAEEEVDEARVSNYLRKLD